MKFLAVDGDGAQGARDTALGDLGRSVSLGAGREPGYCMAVTPGTLASDNYRE